MKTIACFTVVLVVSLAYSGAVGATYSLVPPDRDLDDLDHRKYYTWGVDRPWDLVHDEMFEDAVGATLSFSQIRNWNSKPNVLYIHLLDDAPKGITTGTDNQGGGDYFAGQGVVLKVYVNLPSYPQNLTYTFTDPEVDALNLYAADGLFGLGFDPDCHFYNCGVELEIETALTPVPKPAMLALLGPAAVGVLLRRRAARRTRPAQARANRLGLRALWALGKG